jgi:hypothetical protein
MTNISDYKRDSMLAIVGGSVTNIDTLEITYLQAAGATSNQVNDAWMEVFLANGATSTNWNTAANEFLIALGAPFASLPMNWSWFWITNGGVIAAYDPGMMTFAADADFYSTGTTVTHATDEVTVMSTLNVPPFTGDTFYNPFSYSGGPTTTSIIVGYVFSSDYNDTTLRNKVLIQIFNTAAAVICQVASSVEWADSTDKSFFCSFDGVTGNLIFEIDGADVDDLTYAGRVAPTTGALKQGAGSQLTHIGKKGSMGYIGIDDSYQSTPTDFFNGATPKELDEVTWTEWGAQPLFFHDEGTLSANAGSAGNATVNGTITGPA